MTGPTTRRKLKQENDGVSSLPQKIRTNNITSTELQQESVNVIKQCFSKNVPPEIPEIAKDVHSTDFPDFDGHAAPNPMLQIPGHNGYLQLPVKPRDINSFKDNTSGLKSFKEDEIKICNPAFNKWINSEVLPRACGFLGLTNDNGFDRVIVKADAAILFESSDFNTPQHFTHPSYYMSDLENTEDYLKNSLNTDGAAWLVVALPSTYVEHDYGKFSGDRKPLFLTHNSLATTWIAWAGHRKGLKLPDASGHVALLVYELREQKSERSKSRPIFTNVVPSWENALNNGKDGHASAVTFKVSKTTLESEHSADGASTLSKASLNLEALRRKDQKLIQELLEYSKGADFVLYLADVELIEYMSGCEVTGDDFILRRICDSMGVRFARNIHFRCPYIIQDELFKRKCDCVQNRVKAKLGEVGQKLSWYETVAIVLPRARQFDFLCVHREFNALARGGDVSYCELDLIDPVSIARLLTVEANLDAFQSFALATSIRIGWTPPIRILKYALKTLVVNNEVIKSMSKSLGTCFDNILRHYIMMEAQHEYHLRERRHGSRNGYYCMLPLDDTRKVIRDLVAIKAQEYVQKAEDNIISPSPGGQASPELADKASERYRCTNSSTLEIFVGKESFDELSRVDPIVWRHLKEWNAKYEQARKDKLSQEKKRYGEELKRPSKR